MIPSLVRHCLSASLVLLAAGCGGSRSGDAQSPASGAEVPFDDRSPSEQREYMQAVVLPAMTKIFKASPEPDHFPEVNCVTCHGPGAKSGDFDMPSPHLPRFASVEAAMKEEPEMARYMAEVVVPEMAKLIHEEPFDPATGKGFGCFDCHMKPD